MKEQHLTVKARQRAWKRMIHDTCRSNWAKRVRTKLDLISFNASMKELDDELDKLEKKHPEALRAMADECAAQATAERMRCKL